MTSRNVYLRFIAHIVLLVVFSAVTAWLAAISAPFYWIVLGAAAAIITFWGLLRLFNIVPEKIAYFFNAVENEDSMLLFSEETPHKATAEMNKSLNRINRLIQEAKLQNREQEQYYSVLLEQVATGIVVVNANGSVMQANSAAKKLLNYKEFNHIDQLKRVDESLFQAFLRVKEGDSHQFVKLSQPNGITQLSLQATSFASHGKTLRIVSVQDISNELDAKEIESWLKLIRVLTHEIMNSITPITSLSETLLRHYVLVDEKTLDANKIANTRKGLEVINERGAGLIRFVESYRKLTKLSPPELKDIECEKFIRHLLLLLENEPNFGRIAFSVEIVPRNLVMRADEGQISHVFINLLKNAMQAVETVPQPQIRVTARNTGDGRCEIAVTDNGTGIPPEVMEHIFVPFFTTKENGSGIGLSLSRQVMKNHGGTIEAVSKMGETRVMVRV